MNKSSCPFTVGLGAKPCVGMGKIATEGINRNLEYAAIQEIRAA
jgi:hypothetical protein